MKDILNDWLNRTPNSVRDFAWRPEHPVEVKNVEAVAKENTPKTVPPGERHDCVQLPGKRD